MGRLPIALGIVHGLVPQNDVAVDRFLRQFDASISGGNAQIRLAVTRGIKVGSAWQARNYRFWLCE